jgi:hypothetical protein
MEVAQEVVSPRRIKNFKNRVIHVSVARAASDLGA